MLYNQPHINFLHEQAMIYREVPDSDFSWLSVNDYPYEYDNFIDEFSYEFGDDFVFEYDIPYNIDLIQLEKDIKVYTASSELSFSQTVLDIIRSQEKDEIIIYKRAHLDRKLFSKLRSNINYQPSRNTAIALVFALELELDDAQDLLRKAGFALSHATVSDMIIEYFILNHIYNILILNEMLYTFGQPVIFN